MNMEQAAPVPASPPPPSLATRVASIFVGLLTLIANRAPALGALTWPLHTRITRVRNRFVRLLTLLAAGRVPRLRAPETSRNGGPPPARIPTRKLWLVATLGYQAAGYASQLQHLLDDPETLALLAAAPPHARASAARTLRPLARIIGVTLPAMLQPPPRPKPIRPPRPKPAPLPPLLPLYPQRRPRPMPFMNFAKKPRPA